MDLFVLLTKGQAFLAAFRAGDYRTALDLAADILKLAAPLMPSGSAPQPSPELMPILGGGLNPATIAQVLEIVRLLASIFGKK